MGEELVLLASLVFSLGKHFPSVVTQVVATLVSVCLWQPKYSLDHSVTSKCNLACLKDRICLFLCIIFHYEYQYQAFSGLIIVRRVFIIHFVTARHREQFEVRVELYIDPVTSQVDPRTLLPWNISS